MIPVEKYSICSALNVEYTKQSNTYTVLRNSQRVGPFFIISTGGAPSLFFQRMGPFFIISTGGAPSLLFPRMGPFFIISTSRVSSSVFQQVGLLLLLYYFIGWAGPFFIISKGAGPLLHYFNGLFFLLFQLVHEAPSLLFQRVGPLLYYFKGCTGLCSFVLTFRILLILINFRSNYS